MKKIFTLFFLSTFCILGGQAQTAVVDGVKYEAVTQTTGEGDNAVTTIVSAMVAGPAADFKGGEIVIPNQVTLGDHVKYDVTKVKDHAFKGCSTIKSIVLPSTVTDIDSWSFEASGLVSADFSQTKIEHLNDGVFYQNANLTTVKLPETLKFFWNKGFEDCKSLVNIVLPPNVEAIYNEVFQNSALSSITFNDKLNYIGEHAFLGVPMTSICFPSSLRTIKGYAFEASKLTNVVIPGNVTEMGDGVFYNNVDLKTVVINSSSVNLQWNLFRLPDGVSGGLQHLFLTPNKALEIGYAFVGTPYVHVQPSLVETYKEKMSGKLDTDNINSDFPITLSNEYATFSSAFNVDFSNIEGLKAYKGVVNGNTVTLKEVNKVLAKNGVVLNGEQGTYTAKILDSNAETDNFDSNGIWAAVDGKYLTMGTDYILSYRNDVYAFRPITKSGYLRPGLAYLPLPGGASAKEFSFTFDNTPTGIGAVTTENAHKDGFYYTLGGVKMNKPAKGIYIHNGKKYFNK